MNDNEPEERGNGGLWLKAAGIALAACSLMIPLALWFVSQALSNYQTRMDNHLVRDEVIEHENQLVHADINRRLYTTEAELADVKRRISNLEDRQKK